MSENKELTEPLISVVIPAHNEARCIGKCIGSVLKVGHRPERLEILVIDHSSTDATASLARAAGANVLSITTGRIGAVRNVGLAAAKGEFIAYVDGDCTVPQTWLQSAIAILRSDASVGAVGGPCLSPPNGTWTERSLAPSEVVPSLTRRVRAIATSSFIARTSLLREAGPFDETLTSGEDDDMSNRIVALGLALVSASDCHIVHHGYPRTWLEVLKKEIWHGSHHLEVRTRYDLTLTLAFLFLGASAALPILIATALLAPGFVSFCALSVDLTLQLTPPFLFAAKRILQSPRDFIRIFPLILVGYAYFLGHGIGVLCNLWRRITSHFLDSTTHNRHKTTSHSAEENEHYSDTT